MRGDMKMAKRVNYIVKAPLGRLNVREEPSLKAQILSTLETGAKVRIDPTAKTPDGWKALEDGGFVMAEYLE